MNPRTRRALEFVLDNLVWFMLLVVLAVFSLFIPNYFQLGIFANIIEQSSVARRHVDRARAGDHRRPHGPLGRIGRRR